MLTELQGQIERITFTNEENGFTIAKVKVPGRQDLVCVVGNLMAPMPGEVIKMQGEWAKAQGLSVSTPIIVKYRDEKTDLSTALEELLR